MAGNCHLALEMPLEMIHRFCLCSTLYEAYTKISPFFPVSQHTVSRVGLLDQAEKLISDLGSSQSVLEIQYEGEVSTASWLHLDGKKCKAIPFSFNQKLESITRKVTSIQPYRRLSRIEKNWWLCMDLGDAISELDTFVWNFTQWNII